MKKAQENFLKESDVKSIMGINTIKARQFIEQLEEEGFIEKLEFMEAWRTMVRGNILAVIPIKRLITREVAEQKIQNFIERVKKVNEDPYFLYNINSVKVYGEYINNTQLLNKINLLIALVAKEKDPEKHEKLESQREINATRNFSNIVKRLFYPQTEICEFLKGGVHNIEVRILGEVDYLKKIDTVEIFSITNR